MFDVFKKEKQVLLNLDLDVSYMIVFIDLNAQILSYILVLLDKKNG